MKLRSSVHTICKRLRYPKVITNIEEILKTHIHDKDFHTINSDGRINSIYDENMVIRILEQKYGNAYVRKPDKSRNWYDVKIKSSRHWIPCNIKVSTGGTDNALCKKALVYSLSTLPEDKIPKSMSFNKMIDLIEQNKNNTRNILKEYYYIYVDKKDGTVMIKSLCDIENYVSNPQNWLQINWAKEKKTSLGEDLIDLDSSYIRVRSTLADSLQKLINSSNRLL
jgi:hypothetical protein